MFVINQFNKITKWIDCQGKEYLAIMTVRSSKQINPSYYCAIGIIFYLTSIGTTFYFTFYKNYNWPWQMHRTTIYLSLGLSYFSIIINHIWQICIKNKQYKFIYLFFSSPSFRMVKTAHPRSPLDQQLNRCSQPSAMSYLRICKQNLIQYRPICMNILIPYFRTAPFWQSNILKINVEIYYN